MPRACWSELTHTQAQQLGGISMASRSTALNPAHWGAQRAASQQAWHQRADSDSQIARGSGGRHGGAPGYPEYELERYQQLMFAAGVFLVFWGCLTACVSWAYCTAALSIAAGAVLIDSFRSMQRVQDRLVGRSPIDSCAAGSGDPLCCAPVHLEGLLAAAVSLAVVEATIGAMFTWFLWEALYYKPSSYYPNETSYRVVRWVSFALVCTAACPIIALPVLAWTMNLEQRFKNLAPAIFGLPRQSGPFVLQPMAMPPPPAVGYGWAVGPPAPFGPSTGYPQLMLLPLPAAPSLAPTQAQQLGYPPSTSGVRAVPPPLYPTVATYTLPGGIGSQPCGAPQTPVAYSGPARDGEELPQCFIPSPAVTTHANGPGASCDLSGRGQSRGTGTSPSAGRGTGTDTGTAPTRTAFGRTLTYACASA